MDIKAQTLFFKRLSHVVHSLGTLLALKQPSEELEELLVLAKMRRVSLCFVAFIHYAAERAGISKREHELLDYDEILEISLARGIIPAADKDTVEEFYAMYSDIVSYDPHISIDTQELVQHIPHVYDYLMSFLSRESIHPQVNFAKETTI